MSKENKYGLAITLIFLVALVLLIKFHGSETDAGRYAFAFGLGLVAMIAVASVVMTLRAVVSPGSHSMGFLDYLILSNLLEGVFQLVAVIFMVVLD